MNPVLLFIKLIRTIPLKHTSDYHAFFTLAKIHTEIDRSINILKKKSGMKCIDMCGICCKKGGFDIHPIEAYMLAHAIFFMPQKILLKEKIINGSYEERCVCYTETQQGNGYCSVYAYRPLTCRLFGFAARVNKYGADELITCKPIKEHLPHATQKASELLHAHSPRIRVSDYSYRLQTLPTILGSGRTTINEAIRLGCERLKRLTEKTQSRHKPKPKSFSAVMRGLFHPHRKIALPLGMA